MSKADKKKFQWKKLTLVVAIMVLQCITAVYFCCHKQGFHYDENYSYYSSNVTAGLFPPESGWMSRGELMNEFMVTEGMGFNYSMVKTMQELDVHPPLYYYILHTVCSLTPGVYSKWQGLSINLLFYVLNIILVYRLAISLSEDEVSGLLAMLLFGFSPAVLSGVTFIRMYMLLTFFCMCSILLHIKGFTRDRTLKGFYLPLGLVTFLGFMTHYYFLVFLFFEGAFFGLWLLVSKSRRKELGLYAITQAGAGLLGIGAFPKALSHIFRGYRGTEAIDAFLAGDNLSARLGLFGGILNEYTFGGSLYILLLLLLLLLITGSAVTRGSALGFLKDIPTGLYMVVAVASGYFLVVAKTALTNGNEAVRYEMPVYGLWIILLFILIIRTGGSIFHGNRLEMLKYGTAAVALAAMVISLAGGKVVFLYSEDVKDREFASANSRSTVVYIYNPVNQWMIWDLAPELMEYDKIYYVSTDSTGEIADSELESAEEIIVYAARSDEAGERLEELMTLSGDGITGRMKSEKLGGRLYADIYRIYG